MHPPFYSSIYVCYGVPHATQSVGDFGTLLFFPTQSCTHLIAKGHS